MSQKSQGGLRAALCLLGQSACRALVFRFDSGAHAADLFRLVHRACSWQRERERQRVEAEWRVVELGWECWLA